MPNITSIQESALALIARAMGESSSTETIRKFSSPVTSKPASAFSSKDAEKALEVLAERAFTLMGGDPELTAKGDEGSSTGAKSKKGMLSALWGLTLEKLSERWPETIDWIKKTAGTFGIKTAQASTTSAIGAASSKLGASEILSSSVQDAGFKSIEEMLGNGLYTPANGQSVGNVAGTAATSGVQTVGNIAGGLAGLYSMYEGGSLVADANKIGGSTGLKAGGIGGLTAGLGAGMAINTLGVALGPVGWGALLAGSLLGGGLLGARLGDRDKWKTEGKRLGKLLEQGVAIPEEMLGAMFQTRGRSKEELVNPNFPRDFVGHTDQGFVNNKFALSRDEKDLHPEDIMGYSAFFEKFGNDWLGKFSEEQRWAIAKVALDSGAVREKHGTIHVNWKPELESTVASILAVSSAND